MTKFSAKFVGTAFFIFAFFTLFYALTGAMVSADYYNDNFNFTILYFAMFIVLVILFYFFIERVPQKRHNIILLSIFALTFLIRLTVVFYFNVQPSSDFLFYHECAKIINVGRQLRSNYASVFPHTIGFAAIISLIYKLFDTNILNVQIFNVICSTITAFLVYNITQRLSNKKIGILSAFLFCIFPSAPLRLQMKGEHES